MEILPLMFKNYKIIIQRKMNNLIIITQARPCETFCKIKQIGINIQNIHFIMQTRQEIIRGK